MGNSPLSITVGGRWLLLDGTYGDVEMSTVWPGGSDELSWSYGTLPLWRYRGGEDVAAYYGPVCVWRGYLLEPDPSQDNLTAQGAWREAEGYVALTAGGAAQNIPDNAIDQAIVRGLRWTRPASIRSSAAPVDISQGPILLSELLDQTATSNRWGVNTAREVYVKAADTTPTYQTLPLHEGLGFALDGYASTLIGRYLRSTDSTYQTVTISNTPAAQDHTVMEQIIDLTVRGPLTTTQATNITTDLLSTAAAIPQWTGALEFSYGELLSAGGVPVALETVAAGTVLRVHGGFELAQRLNGAMYVDVPIGRTDLSGGTLTITPQQIAARSLTDVLAAALSK